MVTDGLGCELSFYKSENKSYDIEIDANYETQV